MTRREVRIPKSVEVAEVAKSLALVAPGAAVQPNGKRVVVEANGRRVGVHVKRWQSMVIGQKDKGTLLILRADYPAAIWLWLIPGILPVFIAQYVYDQRVRAWTKELAGGLAKTLGGAA